MTSRPSPRPAEAAPCDRERPARRRPAGRTAPTPTPGAPAAGRRARVKRPVAASMAARVETASSRRRLSDGRTSASAAAVSTDGRGQRPAAPPRVSQRRPSQRGQAGDGRARRRSRVGDASGAGQRQSSAGRSPAGRRPRRRPSPARQPAGARRVGRAGRRCARLPAPPDHRPVRGRRVRLRPGPHRGAGPPAAAAALPALLPGRGAPASSTCRATARR